MVPTILNKVGLARRRGGGRQEFAGDLALLEAVEVWKRMEMTEL
jgi:hypothetical protein